MNKKLEKIRFIRDTPVDDISDIQFGHKEIALSICQIVQNIPFNFTIGIFGGWGTGKSSILNAIKKNLTKNEIFYVFDVWKHKDDALRRTFIKDFYTDLDKNKNFQGNFLLSDELTQTTEKKEESKKVDYKKLIIPAVLSCGISLYVYYDSGVTILNAALYSLFNAIIFSFFFYREKFTDLLTITTVSTSKDKYIDPSEFEREFICLLNEIDANKKVIIVFDNIDRVPEEKAIEVLTTIKTFLEPNSTQIKSDGRLVFLIPCDHDAIKQHVSKMYGKSEYKDSEAQDLIFLEKFFNCTIYIPPFFGVELDKFTFDLLESTGISCFQRQTNGEYSIETHHTAWNIIKGNRNNPRQIKQFINDFLARYLLIQLRSSEGLDSDFETDFCHKNISKIAKALIIQEKFPTCLEYLLSKGYLNPDQFIEEVNSDIAKYSPYELNFPDFQTDSYEFKNFKQFLNDTKNDPIEDFIPYIHGRLSDFEKQIPGVRKFIILLDRGDIAQLETEASILSTDERRDLFSKIIRFEIERKQIIDNICQFFETLFIVFQKFDITLSEDVYQEIKNKLYLHKELLSMLSPVLVQNVLSQNDNKPIDKFILSYWIEKLPHGHEEVFSVIFDHEISQFDEDFNLLKVFNNKLISLKHNNELICALLNISENNQKKYLFLETIENFLVNNDSLSCSDLLSLSLQTSKEIIPYNVFIEIVKSINSAVNNRSPNDELTILLSQFVIKFKAEYQKLIFENNELISEHLTAIHRQFTKFTEKEKLLFALLIIDSSCKNKDKSPFKEIYELIKEVLSSDFARLIPHISQEVSSFLINNHVQEVIERVTETIYHQNSEKRTEFFITLFMHANNEEKSQLLLELIKKSPEKAIEQIKNIRKSKLDYQYSKDVAVLLLEKIVNKGNHQDYIFILQDICDNFPNKSEISGSFISVLIKRFEEPSETRFDEYLQIFNEFKLFSDSDLKRLVSSGTSILDRSNLKRHQPYLSLIIDQIKKYNFTDESRILCRRLLDISISGVKTSEISDVYGYLKFLNFYVNYDVNNQELKSFYDHFLNQISKIQNRENICAHVHGLLTLRPSDVKPENLKFWEQVEDLKKRYFPE